MYLDVVKLRDFYYRSALGRSAQARLQNAVCEIWPDVSKKTMVGYGFASPFLRPFMTQATSISNLMPEGQGVMAWPPGEKNLSALCSEAAWPLGASSVDYLLAVHCVENAHNLNTLLSEMYRVLDQDGRAILVFPNRSGLWIRSDASPFGLVRGFGLVEIEQILAAHRFEIIGRKGALFGAPRKGVTGIKFSRYLEKFGKKLEGRILAGVWVVEIKKTSSLGGIKSLRKEPIFATPNLRRAGALNSSSHET